MNPDSPNTRISVLQKQREHLVTEIQARDNEISHLQHMLETARKQSREYCHCIILNTEDFFSSEEVDIAHEFVIPALYNAKV